MLLRRVIGDALRARRQGQHRTLREISLAANVSLGYLSEIERGQKEPSSELLAAICEALGSQLSEVLREASDTLARAEHTEAVLAGALRGDGALPEGPVLPEQPRGTPSELPAAAEAPVGAEASAPVETPQPAESQAAMTSAGQPGSRVDDGEVSVAVRRDGPLRTTLHAVRTRGRRVAQR